jgi:hypothetical protein
MLKWKSALMNIVSVLVITMGTVVQAQADNGQLPLVRATFSPANPSVGEIVSVFLTMETGFSGPYWTTVFPTATLDGSTAVPIAQSSDILWTTQIGPFLEPGQHHLSVSLNLQNAAEADTLRRAISNLNQEIANLQDQIANETDPAQLAELQLQLEADQTQLAGLQQALSNTSKVIGTDAFDISVGS